MVPLFELKRKRLLRHWHLQCRARPGTRGVDLRLDTGRVRAERDNGPSCRGLSGPRTLGSDGEWGSDGERDVLCSRGKGRADRPMFTVGASTDLQGRGSRDPPEKVYNPWARSRGRPSGTQGGRGGSVSDTWDGDLLVLATEVSAENPEGRPVQTWVGRTRGRIGR